MKKRLIIAGDHAGYDLKEVVKDHLNNQDWIVEDVGTHSAESTDYPDYAHPLAERIGDGESLGILICGSANGVNMTANKHQQVRSAIAWKPEIAALARQHNNANVIALPARFITDEEALAIVDSFLSTDFEGGRHQRRVDRIAVSQHS